jgi:hypothetical protein
MFEQIDGAGIDERKQVSIEVRLDFLGRLIVDPMLAELLPRPLASIPITVDRMILANSSTTASGDTGSGTGKPFNGSEAALVLKLPDLSSLPTGQVNGRSAFRQGNSWGRFLD